jgi:hypothetical protein
MRMKNLPITLTLPENIIKDLHLYISKGQISKFAAKMFEKGLQDKKKQLACELQEASQDQERNAELALWDTLSGEGLDDTNTY